MISSRPRVSLVLVLGIISLAHISERSYIDDYTYGSVACQGRSAPSAIRAKTRQSKSHQHDDENRGNGYSLCGCVPSFTCVRLLLLLNYRLNPHIDFAKEVPTLQLIIPIYTPSVHSYQMFGFNPLIRKAIILKITSLSQHGLDELESERGRKGCKVIDAVR